MRIENLSIQHHLSLLLTKFDQSPDFILQTRGSHPEEDLGHPKQHISKHIFQYNFVLGCIWGRLLQSRRWGDDRKWVRVRVMHLKKNQTSLWWNCCRHYAPCDEMLWVNIALLWRVTSQRGRGSGSYSEDKAARRVFVCCFWPAVIL